MTTAELLVKELGELLPQLEKHAFKCDVDEITKDYESFLIAIHLYCL